ncbi:MAG TPA: hypothetical protein VLT58_15455 [Polyangia bacterium]|nr:hypothetical protein [Polyangia bacterium]
MKGIDARLAVRGIQRLGLFVQVQERLDAGVDAGLGRQLEHLTDEQPR